MKKCRKEGERWGGRELKEEGRKLQITGMW